MTHRTLVAGCIAIGLVGVSIALGTLYQTELRIERAKLEAQLAGYELDDSEQSVLLATFDQRGPFLTALISGTAGVGLLGLGGVLGLFELASLFGRPAAAAAKTVPGPAGTK
ncbi:MAG: hypothetical protein AAF297_07445 [Planctomycetota bacterium]